METRKFINCSEEFELLDLRLWEEILQLGEYKGINYESFMYKLTDGKVRFAEAADDFICGIKKRQSGKDSYYWDPILFYELPKGWQRIALENTVCKNCDWLGTIANPTLPHLYEFLSNDIELMREASKLEQVCCRKCGGPLERNAIWVEPNEPEENEK
ncbi:hypothetical protein [Candidatus Enterococcus clewellii]|uniref:Uncharacterized protein n=1 Tax=Candidatus Enterococcus clewellii TaxID=1834193 RepID=A0AAQ3VRR4_9ENTE